MPSAATQQQATWLVENGPRELESLLRAIVYHPAAPILIADNDRHYRDASFGAGKLLGLPRDEIIGRSLDDFADPTFKPEISELWQAFLERGFDTFGSMQGAGEFLALIEQRERALMHALFNTPLGELP